MAERDAVAFGADGHVLGDGVEPLGDAGVEFDIAALADERLAVDADALLFRLFIYEVHVGDERVGALFACEVSAFGPEGFGVDAQLRQERILLHGRGLSVPSKS